MCTGDKNKVEGVVPGVEAAPVLQLPEGGPIATGEEDENTVFFSESVLFNFDAGWKERGRGELRVLVAPSGQCWHWPNHTMYASGYTPRTLIPGIHTISY